MKLTSIVDPAGWHNRQIYISRIKRPEWSRILDMGHQSPIWDLVQVYDIDVNAGVALTAKQFKSKCLERTKSAFVENWHSDTQYTSTESL